MDRTLPFGFIDHKIKCGNALVGTWIDQFSSYPVMAWKNREGGDRNHTNGRHFHQNARTKTIKDFAKSTLAADLGKLLTGSHLFEGDVLAKANSACRQGRAVLSQMHALPVTDAAPREHLYRKEILGSEKRNALKAAMDLWCSCWFWPAEEIQNAPLPTSFINPSDATSVISARIARRMRFFHWELEFPDVFRESRRGFNAILGNPPWDIAKPISKEFFSRLDPLYRSYGKQYAIKKQAEYFQSNKVYEYDWLEYNARFRGLSNFIKYAASPFGDPNENSTSSDRFVIFRGKRNLAVHSHWREARRHHKDKGLSDPSHPFSHQGSADLNLYKLFLETGYALLQLGGRLGFVVPSGLYSDDGTKELRNLLLETSQWEWLFGIENRVKIFPIDGRFKFNPIIVQKGGHTEAIRTAFMRHDIADWERAEEFAMPYAKAQVEQFSPENLSILEIQSPYDIEVLEKAYSNSVLLGDQGPEGWGIRYTREFDMTNDSKLFPSRPDWEAKGYRPDEYSRWLKGSWRPIEDLWAELGVDLLEDKPVASELEHWLFDTSADAGRRDAEALRVHGQWLKPGDVSRTDWKLRCARPSYDCLPIARRRIPAGVVLSRDGDQFIKEEWIEDIALPLYEGRMIGQFDFSEKEWVSGKGRSADWDDIPWRRKYISPQFLMKKKTYRQSSRVLQRGKISHMSVGSATNQRTCKSSFISNLPAGHKAPVLDTCDIDLTLVLNAIFNSFVFDFMTRIRLGGVSIDYHIIKQNALPQKPSIGILNKIVTMTARLNMASQCFDPLRLELCEKDRIFATAERSGLCRMERIRISCMLDAVIGSLYGLSELDLRRILDNCDLPRTKLSPQEVRNLDPKGFWRIDKDKEPELRHTVLTLIAFSDLQEKITSADGDQNQGIEDFLAQSDGEGWMIPETVCLSDYGLGHDERANHPQPVASRLGPRFYDWQLIQSADESWRECHLHARNLLGSLEYTVRIIELVGRRLRDGMSCSDLIEDAYVRELREDDWIHPAEQVRTRSLLDDDSFWSVIDYLIECGELSKDARSFLLGKLHNHQALLGGEQSIDKIEDRFSSSTDGDYPKRQGDLFE